MYPPLFNAMHNKTPEYFVLLLFPLKPSVFVASFELTIKYTSAYNAGIGIRIQVLLDSRDEFPLFFTFFEKEESISGFF